MLPPASLQAPSSASYSCVLGAGVLPTSRVLTLPRGRPCPGMTRQWSELRMGLACCCPGTAGAGSLCPQPWLPDIVGPGALSQQCQGLLPAPPWVGPCAAGVPSLGTARVLTAGHHPALCRGRGGALECGSTPCPLPPDWGLSVRGVLSSPAWGIATRGVSETLGS